MPCESQSPTWACRTWLPTSGKTTNLVAIHFSKPDPAIRPDRNAPWDGAGIGHGELANLARRRDSPDLAAVLGVVGWMVNKAEVAIRSCCDAVHTGVKSVHREVTCCACRRNAADA